jgi:UDP-N-acetyl-D-glucosamine dehydrogenase
MDHHPLSAVRTVPDEKQPRTAVGVRRVAIIGLGYVGLPLAILAEERGYRVNGFDTDPIKTALLTRREAGFLSEEEARFFRKSRMSVSSDEDGILNADVLIVCVPTPVNDDLTPNLRPLESAAGAVARNLTRGALVVIESTVNPGVCEKMLDIIERSSKLTVERDFFFAHCPERVNPGDTRWNTRTIPRVVGGAGPVSLARAVAFYRSLIDAEVRPMASLKEAEAVKMVENSFRDVNIAFVNELAMSFGKAGIDLTHVIAGASTKPFSFMPHFPGCGVGGHCIPVDPYYLIRYGRDNGFEHRFLVEARRINSGMPKYTVDLLKEAMSARLKRPLSGSSVALLGLSYKRDVPDLRESPALVIRDELMKAGAEVIAYDPFLPDRSNVRNLGEALEEADAAVVATDHSMFRTLSPEEFEEHGIEVVVDGRNCLSKESFLAHGLDYRGIGR